MRFSVPASALKAALDGISGVVQSRQVIPILGSVKITVADDVRVSATNLEVYAEAVVEGCDIEARGEACIPAAELAKLAALAKRQHVGIAAEGTSATVRFGRASAEFITLDVRDFPAAPDWSALAAQDVDGPLLARALRFCGVTMADDETLYYLRGVHLQGRDGGSVATSSDKMALHRATMPMIPISGEAIIPDKHVPIMAAIAEAGGRIRVGVSENSWVVTSDRLRARGSTIDAKFPDVDRIISPNATLVATTDRAALVEAIDVALTGAAKGPITSIVLDISGDEIAVRGQAGPTLAKGTSATIDAETSTSVVGLFNAAYLRDTLRSLDCDRVAILDGGAAHTTILHLEPAGQGTEIRIKGVISSMRATPAELAA